MAISRRNWLIGCAGAVGAGLGSSLTDYDWTHAAAPESYRPKLSIAAYSFRKYLPQGSKPGSMTLLDLCEMAAEWGLDAVEPTSYYFESEKLEYLHALKVKAFRLGLDISGTAIRNDFCHPDTDRRTKEVAHVKRWVDHAVALGAPCIRVFGGNRHADVSDDRAYGWVVANLKEACDYAGSRGVFLAIENHGYLTESAEEVLRIVEGVGHEWLGVNLDSGNFTSRPYENMERLAPYAINVQLKTDVVSDDGDRRRPGDYARIVRILDRAEYRGYVALEYEGDEDPYTGVPKFLERVRQAATGTR